MLKKIQKIEFFKYIIIAINILLVLVNIVTDNSNEFATATLVLITSTYLVVISRKNLLVFFVLLTLLYFDYSVLISAYLLPDTEYVSNLYYQAKYISTRGIGINCLLVFFTVITIFIGKISEFKIEKEFFINKKITEKTKIISIFIILVSIIIFFNRVFFNIIPHAGQIYEYTLILFILGFYYIGDNKKLRIILLTIMSFFVVYTIISGDRVSVLQSIIACFFMFFADKFDYKKIILIMLVGIIAFTILGLYGDCISYNQNLNNLNIKNIVQTFFERRFALDTSVSAYWSGLTFIDSTNFISWASRLINFLKFIVYIFLGNISGYIDPQEITLKSYIHYHGGFLTSYLYYWLGYFGVVSIGFLIGKYLKEISKINHKSNDFLKLLAIYIVSTTPRWFLYFPTPLFRGVVIFSIVYYILYLFVKEKNEND